MSNFYVRICPNGHYEIDYRRAKSGQMCSLCGKQLTDTCPDCGEIIKKWNFYGASMMPPKAADYQPPDVCPKCGAPLPWSGKQKLRVRNRQGR